MTLTTTAIKAVYQGNSATTVWGFDFLIPDQASLVVTLVDRASGNPTVISPVNYTVTGLGNANGGSVTYPLTGSPIAPTTDIVVERSVADVQNTDLINQGGAYPADIEDALDYLTMISQQQQDQINRSIVFSVADTVEVPLPTATARANLFLGFNASGDPVAVDGLTAGTTVSAAMIPVVTAPTTAAALTALGLPGTLLDLLIPSGVCWDYDANGGAPTGFVYPIGQACTSLYPDYRAKLIAAGSPYGTNGVDPLMPDRRSVVSAGKSNMGGVDNGLLPGGTVLGAILGLATINKTILLANLPPYTPAGTVAITAHLGNIITISDPGTGGSGTHYGPGAGTLPIVIDTEPFTGTPQGGTSTAMSITVIQPTIICNKILKVH